MDPYAPPDFAQGIRTALEFAAGAVALGWICRNALRDRRFPRRLAIVVVTGGCLIGYVLMRRVASGQEYAAGFREGAWVYLWVAAWLAAFIGTLFYRNHIVGLDDVDAVLPRGGNCGRCTDCTGIPGRLHCGPSDPAPAMPMSEKGARVVTRGSIDRSRPPLEPGPIQRRGHGDQ